MNHAVISGSGVVLNVVDVPLGWTDPDGRRTVQSDTAHMGWSFDGVTFHAPPLPPPSTGELLAAASVRQNRLLASVWSFTITDADGKPVTLTTKLDDRGQAGMAQLVIFAREADGTDMVEPYSNIDFTSAILTPAMAREMGFFKAGAAKASTYVALNKIAAGILATPPTITTIEQVENSPEWPSPTSP